MAQKQFLIQNNFSKGELSARQNGRVDLQGYYQGCQTMENALMVSQGGGEKRPGSLYLGETYQGKKARLVPFEVNDENRYVVEFTDGYIRLWDVIEEELVSGATFETSFLSTEIDEIQFAQAETSTYDATNDVWLPAVVLYMAHGEHPVQGLVASLDFITDPDLPATVTFSWKKMSQEVEEWKDSEQYEVGRYVKYGSDYYLCTGTPAVDTAPGSQPWNKGDQASIPLSGIISEWSSGATYNAGDLAFYGDNIYKALNTTLNDIPTDPGAEEYDETPWPTAKYKWNFDDLPNLPGNEAWKYVLRQKYPDGYRVKKLFILYKLVWVTVEYRNILVKGEDHWELGCSLPGITTSLVAFNTSGSYDLGQWVYNSVGQTFQSLVASNTEELAEVEYWQKQASPLLSAFKDYPSAIAFMEGRLFLGGSKSHPQTFGASKIDQHENFSVGTEDDDAFTFSISTERSSRIKWMNAKDVLTIGTSDSEWLVSGTSGGPITPTSVRVLKQSAYGSAYQQAIFVADTLLFFQKGGRRLREYVYSNDNKAYLAQDLTFYSDHITRGGIVSSAYQQNPDSILWSVKSDGTLIGLTYNRLNGISGWHKHTTNGAFESLCVVDGEGEEDVLWITARRVVDGVETRFVERFADRVDVPQDLSVFSDCAKIVTAGDLFSALTVTWGVADVTVAYNDDATIVNGQLIRIDFSDNDELDSVVYKVSDQESVGYTFKLKDIETDEYVVLTEFDEISDATGVPVSLTFSGFDHLAGEEVTVLGDGGVFSAQEVSGAGELVFTSYLNTVVAGLGYSMTLQTMSLEAPGQNTLGTVKRISSVLFKVYESLGGTVGWDLDEMVDIHKRDRAVAFGSAEGLYTGDRAVNIPSCNNSEYSLWVRHESPLPMTIMAMVYGETFSRI